MRFTLIFLILLTVIISPLAAFAQDPTEEPEEGFVYFTSEDELFTLMIPEEWETGSIESTPSLVAANTENALDVLVGNDAEGEEAEFESGDQGVGVFALPVEVLTMIGVTVSEETTTEELATIFAEALILNTSEDSEAKIGEVETITLGADEEANEEGLEAGLVRFTTKDREGFVIVYMQEDVIIAATGLTPPGELEDFEELAIKIIESLEFEGTSDELMAIITGEGEIEATNEPGN